jgi:hypothetical protein
MDVMGSNNFPIQTIISIGETIGPTQSTLFKLNVSHLEPLDFQALVLWVWNLSSLLVRAQS